MVPARMGVLDFNYTAGWSTHDRGTSPQTIPGIGVSRCACAVKSFELAHAAGLPTHYIRQVGAASFEAQEFGVPGREALSGQISGRVIPLEWIWRAEVGRTLLKRIKAELITTEVLGFEPGTEVVEGMKLPKLWIECTTKFEPVDRHLSDEEARELSQLTQAQWAEAQRLITRAVEVLRAHFARAGLNLKDGKFELGLRRDGRIVFVDVFGTQDENRIVDLMTGDIHDKDLIRLHLENTPWFVELLEAKKAYPVDKSMWPPYPRLPDQLVKLVAHRYVQVPRRLTA